MANSKSGPSPRARLVWAEFGSESLQPEVTARPEVPANQQNLKVQTSRKGRKGKTVTIISGFQSRSETLTELCKKLKSQCGAGGTVKEQTIEIQGEHAPTVSQFLTGLGYKVKSI